MVRQLSILAWVFFLTFLAASIEAQTEDSFLKPFCDEKGGMMKARLEEAAGQYVWADCLTETHAWEMDFAKKWAEAPMQAVYYAILSQKQPGVVIIVRNEADCNRMIRLWVAVVPIDVPLDIETVGGYDCLRR